ncbi:MAG: InlB B-repeat-containing protein, partial [Clostridia bacterium]|nr:InlB B-repeat-containing protein [Clostridia bacterium]
MAVPDCEFGENGNFVFAGWYDGDEKFDFTAPLTKDVELVAKFNKAYYVTFDGSEPELVNEGSKLVAPVDPEKEADAQFYYEFDAWYLGDKKWDFETDTVSGKTDLVAKYNTTLRQYAVTFNGGSETYVDYGSKLTAPETPTKESDEEFNYEFDGWYDGEKKWDFENDTVTGDVNLTAKFNAVEKKHAKKGCNGSVTASVLSLLGLAFAVVAVAKKKED